METATTGFAPINAGFLTKIWVRLVHQVLSNRHVQKWRHDPGGVIFVSPKLVLKSTPFTRLAEAHAMQIVSENTSIPVPKVLTAFEHKGRTFILMERIEGQRLSQGWVQRPDKSKTRILSQLKAMTEQLRGIPPPQHIRGVCDVTGGPVYDPRFAKDSIWGPFPTIAALHKELRFGQEVEDFNEHQLSNHPGFAGLVTFHRQLWPTTYFTHGDLSSLNIIVRGDDVVGIIDWETAAWMPPYWEYTSAWHVNPQNMFWQEEVNKFLPPDPHALEMEKIRRKYFGDF
ncbi:serine/threonine protein kinase [Coniochaeta sp. 2T2.1]|nr:serine/threonine protein kinase [Coniochaeta sp. 2T2.1]